MTDNIQIENTEEHSMCIEYEDDAVYPIFLSNESREILCVLIQGRDNCENAAVEARKREVSIPGKHRMHLPVGTALYRTLAFLFPKRVFESNFADAIRDMRDETNEADADGRTWHRRWIVLRGNCIIWMSVVIYLKVWVFKKVWDAFKAAG